MNHKKIFWAGLATFITGFLYFKMNYKSTFPRALPESPWISGVTRFFHMNPDFASDIFSKYLGLGVGAMFVIFLLAIWGLKK